MKHLEHFHELKSLTRKQKFLSAVAASGLFYGHWAVGAVHPGNRSRNCASDQKSRIF